ncbi:MAG: cytochrome c biogenesis protein ResB [bacterium]|nr:cytochrome c biogenesis protein ResB [bacterium]
MKRLFTLLFNTFASYWLSCMLFLFLLLLTFLGTVEQMNMGLFDVQRKYFASLFLVHDLFGAIPILLPGVYLLLVLLFVNLICGGIVRARKGWGFAGVLTVHAGIGLLLFGGFVKFQVAESGHLTMFEGDQTAEFQSYYDWEIAIASMPDEGAITEYIIPGANFVHLAAGSRATFTHPSMPLDLTVSGYARNAFPNQASSLVAGDVRVADGFYLEALEPAKDAEQNIPGAYVEVSETSSGATRDAILWGQQRFPWCVPIEGANWTVDLRKKRTPIPFTIALKKFTRELHPRTSIPKVFMSEVVKIEDGISQDVTISMNAPLRHKGYTFYQASWGPPNAGPRDRLYSTLAVVKDPAERVPLYASLVVTAGLLLHFAIRLVAYLRAEHGKSA